MPNWISGSWRADSLSGTAGDDIIDGGSNTDTLDGGAGNDSLYGGSGDDTLFGGAGDDSLDGGSQDDLLSGGAGDDTLEGASGDDVLSGGDGGDFLDGGSGQDSLFGGAGDDTLFGDHGSDLMDGGAGDDLILAGAYDGGQDTIVFGPDSGHDTALGFSPVDDVIHIGGASIDDVILTATADPRIWVLTLDGVPGASLTLDFSFYWDGGVTLEELEAQVVSDEDFVLPNDPYPSPICLTTGAMVAVPGGTRPVERLRAGDLVLTRDAGPQPVRAVLRNRIPAAAMAADPALRPVRIGRGAFGADLPQRDMLVSLQHAFLAWDGRPNGKGEVLIRARHIAEEMGRAGLVERPARAVTYHHLLMDRHHLILADGVWTETVFTGDQALAADPVLARLVQGRQAGTMHRRVRPLLLRKHLRRYAGHVLGRGDPAAMIAIAVA